MTEITTDKQLAAAPAELRSQAVPEFDGLVVVSRCMMRSVMDGDPLNQEHAGWILAAVAAYKRHYDPLALELARELWRRVNEYVMPIL